MITDLAYIFLTEEKLVLLYFVKSFISANYKNEEILIISILYLLLIVKHCKTSNTNLLIDLKFVRLAVFCSEWFHKMYAELLLWVFSTDSKVGFEEHQLIHLIIDFFPSYILYQFFLIWWLLYLFSFARKHDVINIIFSIICRIIYLLDDIQTKIIF